MEEQKIKEAEQQRQIEKLRNIIVVSSQAQNEDRIGNLPLDAFKDKVQPDLYHPPCLIKSFHSEHFSYCIFDMLFLFNLER